MHDRIFDVYSFSNCVIDIVKKDAQKINNDIQSNGTCFEGSDSLEETLQVLLYFSVYYAIKQGGICNEEYEESFLKSVNRNLISTKNKENLHNIFIDIWNVNKVEYKYEENIKIRAMVELVMKMHSFDNMFIDENIVSILTTYDSKIDVELRRRVGKYYL